MAAKNKQYRTALNNYLKGKISRPVFFERADMSAVSAAEAEADITRAKDFAAGELQAMAVGSSQPADHGE